MCPKKLLVIREFSTSIGSTIFVDNLKWPTVFLTIFINKWEVFINLRVKPFKIIQKYVN